MLQAAPEFRQKVEDIGRFYVRSGQQDMVPLSTLASRITSYNVCYTKLLRLRATISPLSKKTLAVSRVPVAPSLTWTPAP